ncbi:hypothetical protein PWY87_34475 [Kribbella solani]|uniref:hypothetical protein n=1 Tax=Kribbella solani TaxID=236067 RepID=UPI0029BD16D0|nr:hypothetical protein [Kribbella solani]MDX2972307.1 hypothetical protein [Kribbella solani]MDX3006824.1 hypothetical protein [Kribbella solani]
MSGLGERQELFGFFHEDTFTSARQAADVRGAMAEFADRWNYRLAKVFTAKPGDGVEVFEACARRYGVMARWSESQARLLAPYGDVYTLVTELRELSGQPVMRSEPEST